MFAAVLALASCAKWTTPERLDYEPERTGSANPEALAAYKAGKHKATMVLVQAPEGVISSRNQHLTAYPDSTDIICLTGVTELPSVTTQEMDQVRKSGTSVIYRIDHAALESKWKIMVEEGTQPESFTAWLKENLEPQFQLCDKYGFDGIEISYLGNVADEWGESSQKVLLDLLTPWIKEHKDKILIIRGYVNNFKSGAAMQILQKTKYIVVVPKVTDTSDGPITLTVKGMTGTGIPSDRYLLEVTIPKALDPVQEGPEATVAATWVTKETADFTRAGLSFANARDDYYTSWLSFGSIRKAISIMNPVNAQ